jgi:hypothetical protein
MAEQVGGIFFERGDDASPVAYTRMCHVFSISGLGETNALVETTDFCSGGNREYIGGLADGTELTIEANYDALDSGLSQLITDAKNKTIHDYRIQVEDGGSPQTNFTFEAIPLSWTLNPSVDDRNTISFTYKISGSITIA